LPTGSGEAPCYVATALGGHGTHASRSRLRVVFVAFLAFLVSAVLAACGGDSSPDASERAGTYEVEVTDASFPSEQELGTTSLMKLGIRNNSEKAIPALVVNVSLAGKEGRTSTIPFGIRDPQPELAQPDRPVWVLAEHYPKFAGSAQPGGSEGANEKSFDFGKLKAGATASVVWKLSAVRTGRYTIVYGIDAGTGGQAKAETANGVAPGGTFTARISSAPRETEVTDSGEVVEK
jgi:hypothetical protein